MDKIPHGHKVVKGLQKRVGAGDGGERKKGGISYSCGQTG